MSDILLIHPPFEKIDKTANYDEPLGITYIAASLERAGFETEILDCLIEEIDKEGLKKYIKKNRPKIVGITAMTSMMQSACESAELVKEVDENIKTVIGGVHPTLMPEETLEAANIDIVVVGEGEISMTEVAECLLNKKNLNKVSGIIYNNESNEKISNPPRELNANLDELPFPARHLLPQQKYQQAPVMGKRGCPFNCIYCSSAQVTQRKVRFRSPENVVDEVENIVVDHNRKKIVFYDDVFSVKKSWAEEVCNEIIKKKIKFSWECNTRVDLIDTGLLRLMKEANCKRITFGIEGGTQNSLDRMNKNITLEQAEKAVKMVQDAGMIVLCNFMLGFDWEKKADIEETIAFAKKLDPHYVRFAIVTPYPGSEFHRRMREEGKLKSLDWKDYIHDQGEPVAFSEHVTSDELKNYLYRAHKEFYYQPKVALRIAKTELLCGNFKWFLRAAPKFLGYLKKLKSNVK